MDKLYLELALFLNNDWYIKKKINYSEYLSGEKKILRNKKWNL